MMIGGGGVNCGRSDHGIGITENGGAYFSYGYDFGDDNSGSRSYSLNLWIK